jgi:hypothetical protein
MMSEAERLRCMHRRRFTRRFKPTAGDGTTFEEKIVHWQRRIRRDILCDAELNQPSKGRRAERDSTFTDRNAGFKAD